MPVPSTLESLSPTAQTDPAAGDSVSAGDDNLRAAFQFIRQTVTAGSDIASASTITPPSTGNSFNVTGTTTVTAIGAGNSWDGRIVWFRHTGAHSFTNSSTLVCLGGASITFASGDISAWRYRTSGTAWDQVVMHRAAPPTSHARDPVSRSTTGTFTTYTQVFENGGDNFNVVTGVYTCPFAGRYFVSFHCAGSVSSGTGTADVYFMRNGSATTDVIITRLALQTLVTSGAASGIISAASGDLLRLDLNAVTGTGPNIAVGSFCVAALD